MVEVVGRGDAASAPPGATVRVVAYRGLLGRLTAAVRSPLRARGRVIVVVDPDALLGAAFRRGRRRDAVVADCQEDYAALLHDRAWASGIRGAAARAVASATVRLAARADLTVVADDHVPPLVARSRLVVRNVPSGDYLPSVSDPDPEPRAVYIGDVRRSRGLHLMLEAIQDAPGWRLDVVGAVSDADRPWLEAWQARSPAADRVSFHGRLPPAEAWAYARGAWVGLCLLESTPAFDAALPSKVYEYLGCGLPVIVTPRPRTAALVHEVGAGVVAEGAAETAGALRAYVDESGLLDRHRAAASAWGHAQTDAVSPYATLADRIVDLVGRTKAGAR